jgi:hypothetical protein
MTTIRRSGPPIGALSDPEMAALRDVSNHRVVGLPMLNRLKKRLLIEQKLGGWTTTQQGHIQLMFRVAR